MVTGKSETPAHGARKRPLTLLLATVLAFGFALGFSLAGSKAADSAARAKIFVSPQGAKPGSTATVVGSGFPKKTGGYVSFNGRKMARLNTTSAGRLKKRWTVPANAKSGPVTVRAGARRAGVRLRVSPPPAVQGQRWSNPATWDGAVPEAGDTVTIPAGKTVVLDTSPPPLAGLEVNGTLRFEDKPLTLRSGWIMVHGKMEVGTPQDRFESRARIVLTGSDRSQNVMNMGAKVLGVMGGTLDVHGQERAGWTRLAATATKGASKLALVDASGWRAGDKIVVASTDYDPGQAEERTITAVSGNTVALDQPLAYTHWGTVQTVAGAPVDERAEVGLLSRNVTIEGEEATSGDGFGGQIMVMNEHMDGMTRPGVARIDGAELTRMGQKNVLRRYPLHFHMLGAAGDSSYLKNSSIHETFNRCLTVHGTDKLDIAGNVCHDHLGHGYFFEDGAETDNNVTGNLGLTTRRPVEGERLLPSDRSPATFWITNPDNNVRNNVAAGSEGFGFWLAFPEHPTGLSSDPDVWPRRTPLGVFSGNVAHSNNDDGLHVDAGPRPDGETETTYYHPRLDPKNGGSEEVVASFENFVGYKNRNRAVWLRGENHRLTGAVLADNGIGATFASSESFLENSLVVGETANKGNVYDWQKDRGWVGLDGRSLPRYWDPGFPIRGFEFYDGRVGTKNTTFANFVPDDQRRASGLGVLLADAFSLHPRNFAGDVRFANAQRFYMRGPEAGMDGDNSAVFVDGAGSVTGEAGSVVTAKNAFLNPPEGCTLNAGWNAYVCPPGTQHVGLISQALEGEAGRELRSYVKPLTVTRQTDGKTQTLMGCCDGSTDASTNLLPDRSYGVSFNGGTPQKMRFVLRHGNARWLRLSIPYAATPKVTKYGCDLASSDWCGNAKAGDLEDLNSKTTSSYYYDAAGDRLYLKLYARNRYNPDDVIDYEELEVAPAP